MVVGSLAACAGIEKGDFSSKIGCRLAGCFRWAVSALVSLGRRTAPCVTASRRKAASAKRKKWYYADGHV